jgi:hypothetical protein
VFQPIVAPTLGEHSPRPEATMGWNTGNELSWQAGRILVQNPVSAEASYGGDGRTVTICLPFLTNG